MWMHVHYCRFLLGERSRNLLHLIKDREIVTVQGCHIEPRGGKYSRSSED